MKNKKDIEEDASVKAEATAKEMMAEILKVKEQNKQGKILFLLEDLAKFLCMYGERWTDLLYAEMQHQRGEVLQELKNWAGARESFRDASFLRKRIKDYPGLARSKFALGKLKLAQTENKKVALYEFLEALPDIQKALEISKETSDEKTQGDMKHYLAFIDQIQELFQKALTEYSDALTSRNYAGDKQGIATTKVEMAGCYYALGDISNAELLINEALIYFTDRNNAKMVEQLLKTKEKILKKKSNRIN